MNKKPLDSTSVFAYRDRINHYLDERKKLDLNTVYSEVIGRYPVILTNAYALDNGREEFDEDYQILYGVSSAGQFVLYDNGLDIIFDADKIDGTYTHWHPIDIEEAINDVILFMNGMSKY